jgi:glycosyltransferase involved in cell wall biosynthesis
VTTSISPRVSVIVTCYDLGRHLEEAIDSVREQTYRDIELLLVDDGSRDPDTLETIEAQRRRGVRVLRIENRGLPGARNAGIVATGGELVCCLDADDILEPELIQRSVEALDAEPALAFVSHWLRAFGDEEWDWTPERCDLPALLDTNTVNGAALVRRQALESVGLFDERMREGCEDWDLWISLVERGWRGTILPEFLFRYRRRADSMSRQMNLGAAHPALYGRLVRKHEQSYRRHLRDLWLRRAGIVFAQCRHAGELKREMATWLEPRRAACEERLARLRRDSPAGSPSEGAPVRRLKERLERERVRALEEQLAAAHHDARALRASSSWRLTAPLRWLHRRLGAGRRPTR